MLVCLLVRDMENTSQGHRTVDKGSEIEAEGLKVGTGGLCLSRRGPSGREEVLLFLARGLARFLGGLELTRGANHSVPLKGG